MEKANIESYDYIMAVLDKAENGKVIDGKVWDKEYIGQRVKGLISKYDIKWNPEILVPSDNDLADRLFDAAMELALESGVYCINSSRQMKWSKDELAGAVSRAPSDLVVGQGRDSVTLHSRQPEANQRVVVIGGAYGILISEDLYGLMVEAYAREKILDIIETPSLPTTRGMPIRIGSPLEAIVARQEADIVLAAIKRAGRPGVCVAAAETSGTEIIELAATSFGAFRQTDWHHASLISENKVSYADLTRAVHFAQTGSIVHTFCDPIYGGYLGGAAGTAIGCTAGCILQRATLFSDTVNAGPSHAHLALDTHPDMLALQGLSFQALARNTKLINGAHIRPASGPCEKDIFYEVAALVITAVTSGVSFLKTVQSATGRHMGHATPLEARFAAQVAHQVEGMTRNEGNKIVISLANKYRERISIETIGKSFQEAYDMETLQPTAEWLKIYEDVCAEFASEFGIRLDV